MTTPGPPLTRATQAGFGVMEHFFFTKRSTKPELISKMEFPIDLGFSLVDRYIVTALGKIKKQFLSDWEVFKKIQFFFRYEKRTKVFRNCLTHLEIVFFNFS